MKLLVSALEPSANLHLRELKKHLGEEVEMIGIFDKNLGNPTVDLSALAIMGIVDALKKLPFFLRLARQMTDLSAEADKVLLIDSSGFNLPLAKKIKKRYPDKEIIYYILPQAWVWKRYRIPVLERTIDRLCSILPFEPACYSPNAPVEYVGHPLLDEIPRFKERLSENGTIVYMPGSRRAEITRLLPVFRALKAHIGKRAVIVIPASFDDEHIASLYGDLNDFEISRNTHQSLYEADFAFICSGTATLEASLIGTPFVLAFIAKKIDYAIGRRLVKLDFAGLGNIMYQKMCGGQLHPEFIQDAVTVDALYEAYERFNKERFFEASRTLKAYLGHGSSARMAEIIEG